MSPSTSASGRQYQVCRHCVMDTSEPLIRFNEQGVCNHCAAALERMRRELLPAPARHRALEAAVSAVKAAGAHKEYDCILGVSGGVDSSMVAYTAKELGLRPLAVHLDNGWNTELAVDNIKQMIEKLQIDLYTHVVDWEEFRDIQLSFLRASVPGCEIPTDHGITALLFRAAAQHGVRYILSGSNLVTEAIMPVSWGHYGQDLKHIRALQRHFGSRPIRTLPTISFTRFLYYVYGKRIRQLPFLNLVGYDREAAKRLLSEKVGWRDYGGKHHESVWTRYFQAHYLPLKFGFDKRRAHFSTMICSGLMSREEALRDLELPLYAPELLRQDEDFVIKKFGLTREGWNEIMRKPPRSHREYPGHHFALYRLGSLRKTFRKAATSV